MIVSADDFFMRDGVYCFNPNKLSEAHNACFLNYLGELECGYATRVLIMSGIPGSGKSTWARKTNADAVARGDEVVIVDNTNLKAWEISPYVLGAGAYKIPYTIVRVHCDPNVAWEREIHDVPREAFGRMVESFRDRDVLPWWPVQDV